MKESFSILNYPLSHVFLGAVVQNPHAHFRVVGGGEKLDAGAVKGGAEPCLRIQPQIFTQPLLMPF